MDSLADPLDPGFGFGKTLEHNLSLLAGLETFADLGVPLLAGMSRKRMIGELTGRDINERLVGSVAAHLMAAERGAMLLRVHDVAAMRDALAVWSAVRDRTKVAPKAAKKAMPRWPDDE